MRVLTLQAKILLFVMLIAFNRSSGQHQSPAINYSNIVKCGVRDKEGNLWFATTWAGIYKYDGKKFIQYTIKDGLASNLVNIVFEDKTGTIWAGTNKGVNRFNGKAFQPFILSSSDNVPSFINSKQQYSNAKDVQSIFQDRNGNMWFGIWNSHDAGAYKYDGKTITAMMPDKSVQGIIEDNEGGVWLNNQRYKDGVITDYSGKAGIFKALVYSSSKDKEGNLWFAVRADTVYKYDGKNFTKYSAKDNLIPGRVSCVFQDKSGGYWFGTDVRNGIDEGYLYRFDGKKFTAVKQIYDAGMNSVWTAVEDRQGNIWFGGRGGGLCRYDGKNFINMTGFLK